MVARIDGLCLMLLPVKVVMVELLTSYLLVGDLLVGDHGRYQTLVSSTNNRG